VRIGQSGQYNFGRSLERADGFAQRYAEVQFCDEALALVFLLSKQYAPFYKWRHKAVKSVSALGALIHDRIAALLATHDGKLKLTAIDQICLELVQALKKQRLTHVNSDFMIDHVGSIAQRLGDPLLRRRFSMVT
jgi:hypothetical protein